MYDLSPKDIARFWLYVKKCENGCWEWQACLTHSGYGRFQVHPKTYRAHRIAYFLMNGDIKNGLCVCHSCDNACCVNPQHLFLGTSKQNTHDMISKGRLVRCRGENKGVSYRKGTGKWRARYMKNYENVLVGEFDSQQEALEALKKARDSS